MTDGDPAINAWVLQWMSHALVHDPLHWYAGNTFYPYPHPIVLADPLVPLAVLNVPVRWFTSNPWVGYNLLIVAAYYLSCVSGAALAGFVTDVPRRGGLGRHLLGLSLLPRPPHRTPADPVVSVDPGRRRDAAALLAASVGAPRLLFVLAFVVQALVSWYLAVMTTVMVVIVVLLRPIRDTWRRPLVKYYVLIVATIVIAIAPFAMVYRAGFADSTLSDRETRSWTPSATR